MMRCLSILAWLVLLAPSADAQMDEMLGDESYSEAIDLMSECSGSWMFFAAVQRRMGNTATAERMSELRNDASLAAQYLLQIEHAQQTGNPKAVGEFEPYVVARYEATLTRLTRLFENEQYEQLEAEMTLCTKALPAQDSILQMLRDSANQHQDGG